MRATAVSGLALLSLVTMTATAPPAMTDQATGFDWIVVPVIKFNDDIGLMYGIHTIFKEFGEDDRQPFEWFLEVKFRHSTKNRHEHWLYFDAPGLFGARLRILGELLRIDDANYFGVGNNRKLDDPGQVRFQYRLTEPRVQTFLSNDIFGHWQWGAGVTVAYTDTKYEATSLLAADRPTGFDGGHLVLGVLALVYDSTDDDLRPRQGAHFQVYAKAATRPLGSAFSFQGVGVEARWYQSPLVDLVYAARLIAEELGGDVPFYEQARIGGGRSAFGVGGVFTQRGFSESRFIGKRKVLTNHELRYYFPPLFDRLSFGVGVFGDASVVADLDLRLRPSAGVELTAKWKELAVVRANIGFSDEETVFYVEGRHMF